MRGERVSLVALSCAPSLFSGEPLHSLPLAACLYGFAGLADLLQNQLVRKKNRQLGLLVQWNKLPLPCAHFHVIEHNAMGGCKAHWPHWFL
jgi:hypothetical protein